MRILIAEDNIVTSRLLQALIQSWGDEAVTAADGLAALAMLEADNAPPLALLDWMLPGLAGPAICRALRERQSRSSTYIIMLTSKNERSDVVAGLDAGADDYLVKPFDPEELRARVRAGARIVDLQQRLAVEVHELKRALGNVRMLSGLLPICAYCKAIRDDSDYWHQVEEYVTEHSDVHFSHGICPKCLKTALTQAGDGS